MNCNQISRPIAYGNIAFWLGKKADQTQSYKWICFVRGINNEDISYFVKEVVFTLHPSFSNHIRVISTFPFEIQEYGWGEFEINIKIYFTDEYQKPVELFHLLKLHPSVPNIVTNQKKPLVSEFYDEIVFLNPSKEFAETVGNFDKAQNEQKLKYEEEQQKQQQALFEQQQQQPQQQQQQQQQTQMEQELEKEGSSAPIEAPSEQQEQLFEEQSQQKDQTSEQYQLQQQNQGIESQNNEQLIAPENNYQVFFTLLYLSIQQHLSDFSQLIPIHQQQLEDALSYVNFELKQLKDKIYKYEEEINKQHIDWDRYQMQISK